MLIKLQWTVTRSENGQPVEYHAQLPSGAVAYVRCDNHLWISIVQLRGAPDQTATFATVYDAETAIAGDEVRRLIELGATYARVTARVQQLRNERPSRPTRQR